MLRDSELSCPRCGEPMERGHLVAGFPGLRWSRGRPAISGMGALRQRRLSRTMGYFRQASVEAARCQRCGIGLFSESAERLAGDNFSDTSSWWAGRP